MASGNANNSSWGYLLAVLISAGVCSALGIALMAKNCHLIANTPKRILRREIDPRNDDARVSRVVVRYGTWLSVVMYLAICVESLMARLMIFVGATELFPCAVFAHMAGMSLLIAKSAMYSVFTGRCHVAYDNSVYGYSQRIIYSLYALIAFVLTVISILHSFLFSGHNESTNYAADGRHVEESSKHSLTVCVLERNRAVLAAGALFDLMYSVLILVLFTRPLKHLLKQQNAMGVQRTANLQEISFELLPVKYTLVSTVAIMSTLLMFVLSVATQTSIFLLMDCVVNMACLLAMNSHWAPIFWWVCGPLLRCVSLTPWFGERNKTNVNAMIAHFSSRRIVRPMLNIMPAAQLVSPRISSPTPTGAPNVVPEMSTSPVV